MEEKYMRRAIDLARKGEGRVNPNPLVGAVIVKNGEIIGEGYHKVYGGDHAEVEALKNTREDPSGGEIYVNLEPCSHYGKTPPCAKKIVEAGIGKVYIGMEDPNPRVAGRGIEILRRAGIQVELGILEEEARLLNEVFIHYMEEKKPFIAMKWAMTLDGKIATKDFESKWITSEESREDVQRLRNKYSGIMVGSNTVLKDNPRLNCRLENSRNPVKIVLDSSLRIGLDSNILTSRPEETIIFTSEMRNLHKEKKIRELGTRVFLVARKEAGLDLGQIVGILGREGIDSILLEGGAKLNFSALEAGLVDRVHAYISPKIIGGEDSKTPVAGRGVASLGEHFKLDFEICRFLSEDIYIEGKIRK